MADTTKKQSPLDILEDILDNAEEQKEVKEKIAKEAKEAAEMEAKEKASEQVDLEKIAAHRAQMANIGETSQEQARTSQIQGAIEEKAKKKSEQEGFEIRQLGHSKI